MTFPYPTKERAVRSLLVAPVLPVGILFLLDAFDRAFHIGLLAILGAALLAFYTLVVIEAFAVVLGGLTLAVIWRRVPFNLYLCSLVGGLVAALPFVLFALFPGTQEPLNYDAWFNGRATVVNGVKTSYGRWRDLLSLLQIFGLGLTGGAFFWWLCRPASAEPTSE